MRWPRPLGAPRRRGTGQRKPAHPASSARHFGDVGFYSGLRHTGQAAVFFPENAHLRKKRFLCQLPLWFYIYIYIKQVPRREADFAPNPELYTNRD
jgi:hypothetical protein